MSRLEVTKLSSGLIRTTVLYEDDRMDEGSVRLWATHRGNILVRNPGYGDGKWQFTDDLPPEILDDLMEIDLDDI